MMDATVSSLKNFLILINLSDDLTVKQKETLQNKLNIFVKNLESGQITENAALEKTIQEIEKIARQNRCFKTTLDTEIGSGSKNTSRSLGPNPNATQKSLNTLISMSCNLETYYQKKKDTEKNSQEKREQLNGTGKASL